MPLTRSIANSANFYRIKTAIRNGHTHIICHDGISTLPVSKDRPAAELFPEHAIDQLVGLVAVSARIEFRRLVGMELRFVALLGIFIELRHQEMMLRSGSDL